MNSPTHTPSAEVIDDQGVLLWVVTFGTIVLWLIHVAVEISLAGYSRAHPSVHWVMDGLTVVLALAAGLVTFASWRIVRRHQQDESHVSPHGRTAFLGWMGVFIGACDVALIVLEGVYLVTIHG